MNLEDYTQRALEEEGQFRAFPVAWTLEPKESGAVAIAFRFAVQAKWHGKDGWSAEWPPGYFVDNRTWVVKKPVAAKDNQAARPAEINQAAVENLSKCSLWNGDFDALAGPVPSVFVIIDVASEVWESKTRFRANWVNPNADEPTARGGFTPADPDVLQQMRARFGSQTRAVAGGKKTGTPSGPPTSVPAPQVGTTPAAPPSGPSPASEAFPGIPQVAPSVPAAAPLPPAAAPAAPVAAPVTPPVAPPVAPPAPALPIPGVVDRDEAKATQAATPPPLVQPPVAAPQSTIVGIGDDREVETPAAPAAPPPVTDTGEITPPPLGDPDDPIDPGDTPF